MKRLNADLAAKKFSHIYLLYGPEEFLIRSYKASLKQGILTAPAEEEDDGGMMGMMGMMGGGQAAEEMNYTQFEGPNVDLNKVRETAQTMPFFAPRRLIVLENTGIFKKEEEGWLEFMENLPDTTYLIFIERDLNRTTRLYKRVVKNWYAANLDHPDNATLGKWCIGTLEKMNATIEKDALALFIEKCCDSMDRMNGELTKLASYSAGKPITCEMVNLVTIPTIEDQIFAMIEAVAAGKEQEALSMYYDLEVLKEAPEKVMLLLGQHFHRLRIMKSLRDDGRTEAAIASSLKMNPYIVKKMCRQASAFSKEELRDYDILCVDTNTATRTGGMEKRVALQLLIVTISRRMQVQV